MEYVKGILVMTTHNQTDETVGPPQYDSFMLEVWNAMHIQSGLALPMPTSGRRAAGWVHASKGQGSSLQRWKTRLQRLLR